MHYREPKEQRIRCRTCNRIIETVRDINYKLSAPGSKICTKCAPLKEMRAW
jgi:hypothetical protein